KCTNLNCTALDPGTDRVGEPPDVRTRKHVQRGDGNDRISKNRRPDVLGLIAQAAVERLGRRAGSFVISKAVERPQHSDAAENDSRNDTGTPQPTGPTICLREEDRNGNTNDR